MLSRGALIPHSQVESELAAEKSTRDEYFAGGIYLFEYPLIVSIRTFVTKANYRERVRGRALERRVCIDFRS